MSCGHPSYYPNTPEGLQAYNTCMENLAAYYGGADPYDPGPSTPAPTPEEGAGDGGILAKVYHETDQFLDDFVQEMVGILGDVFTPILTGLFVLLIAWQGYKLMVGKGPGETLTDAITLVTRYVVVIFLINSYPFFDRYVNALFVDSPDLLAGMIVDSINAQSAEATVDTSEASDAMDALDRFWERASEWAQKLAPGYSIGEKLEALVILALASIFCVIAAFQIILAVLVMNVFLAIAPIALVALMLPQTRMIFEGWLRVLTTMGFIKLFIAVILAVLLFLFDRPTSEQNETFTDIGVFTLVVTLMIIAVWKATEFATQIGGGMAISGANLAVRAAQGAVAFGAGAVAGAVAGSKAAARGAAAAGEVRTAAREAGIPSRQAAWTAAAAGVDAARTGTNRIARLRQRDNEEKFRRRRLDAVIAAMKAAADPGAAEGTNRRRSSDQGARLGLPPPAMVTPPPPKRLNPPPLGLPAPSGS